MDLIYFEEFEENYAKYNKNIILPIEFQVNIETNPNTSYNDDFDDVVGNVCDDEDNRFFEKNIIFVYILSCLIFLDLLELQLF